MMKGNKVTDSELELLVEGVGCRRSQTVRVGWLVGSLVDE